MIHLLQVEEKTKEEQMRFSEVNRTVKDDNYGKWDLDDIERILLAKNRAKAGPTAPAEGLYFLEVIY